MKKISVKLKARNHIVKKILNAEGKKHQVNAADMHEILTIQEKLFKKDQKFRYHFMRYLFFSGGE